MGYLDLDHFRDDRMPVYGQVQNPLVKSAGAARRSTLLVRTQTDSEGGSGFTPLQWRVIELTREDSVASLREETKFGKFLRLIFGWGAKRPLADAKLEALRRMAVMSWHHGYNVDGGNIEAFLASGYSLDQYETLLGHIVDARTESGMRTRP